MIYTWCNPLDEDLSWILISMLYKIATVAQSVERQTCIRKEDFRFKKSAGHGFDSRRWLS